MIVERFAARTLNRRARRIRVWCDIAVLALVSATISWVGDTAPRSVFAACAGALLFLFLCAALGLYARTFAQTARDEIYPLGVAAVLALIAVAGVALVGRAEVDWPAGCAAIVIGAIACGTLHMRLHAALVLDSPSGAAPRAALAIDSRAGRALKRSFDLVLALVVCIPVAVACAAIAVVVLVDDGAPIFFSQERAGRDGVSFRMLKFRTMRRDADDRWAVRGDTRITRSGGPLRRWSLDELPQLLNVVRGEMSLVGPRPEMVAYAAEFARTIPRYVQRGRAKPGITGWAQVTLPRNLQVDDAPDVLAADLFYIDHWSPMLDSVIVLKTAAEVVFHRAV